MLGFANLPGFGNAKLVNVKDTKESVEEATERYAYIGRRRELALGVQLSGAHPLSRT